MSSLYDVRIDALDGSSFDLSDLKGSAILLVNVASQCGLTPQYAGLERIQERFEERGFTVLGVPCNQFGAQEPGSPDEIAAFCSRTYGVTFPLTEKVDVNGESRHELYRRIIATPDNQGRTGDIRWNFEKFLISRNGDVVARFSPDVEPEDEMIISAIEAQLP